MKDLAFRVTPVVAALPAASAALAGVIVRLSIDGKPYWCDGLSWLAMTQAGGNDARVTTARATADVINSTTTLANATGLTLPLEASTTYAVEAKVMFQTAATTTGIRLTQSVPAGAVVVAQWRTPISLVGTTSANQRAADTGAASTGIDVANSNTLACGSLSIVTGATAGNLQIRFASEIAASNAVIKAGSNLVMTKIA